MTAIEDRQCDERDENCKGPERACDICNIIYCDFHGDFVTCYKQPAPSERDYTYIYYPLECEEAKAIPSDTPKVELCDGCVSNLEEIF